MILYMPSIKTTICASVVTFWTVVLSKMLMLWQLWKINSKDNYLNLRQFRLDQIWTNSSIIQTWTWYNNNNVSRSMFTICMWNTKSWLDSKNCSRNSIDCHLPLVSVWMIPYEQILNWEFHHFATWFSIVTLICHNSLFCHCPFLFSVLSLVFWRTDQLWWGCTQQQ